MFCGEKDLRRHRSEVSVELRKAKKDDQLSKRRNMDDDSEPGSPLQDKNAQASFDLNVRAFTNCLSDCPHLWIIYSFLPGDADMYLI